MKNSARTATVAVSADGRGLVSQAGAVLLWETMRVTGLGRGAPFRGAALHPDLNSWGSQQRWHGRDRQSKTVWTWSAERKEP